MFLTERGSKDSWKLALYHPLPHGSLKLFLAGITNVRLLGSELRQVSYILQSPRTPPDFAVCLLSLAPRALLEQAKGRSSSGV